MSQDFIRKAYQNIPLTEEQLLEMARLMKRPTGLKRFIHYVDIDTKKGPQKLANVIKPYQFDMLELMQNNDRTILLASRQMSKCVYKDTKIIVKNNKTQQIEEITIEDFFERIKRGRN